MARRKQIKKVVVAQAVKVIEPEEKEKTLDILRLICAFFFPPLGVFLQVGLGVHFWINLPLTFFGWIPGIVHAVYIILTRKD